MSIPTSASNNDPAGSTARDLLANERTFLAWLRTAANVMIVGLAVARFGDGGDVSTDSLIAGALLLGAGTAGIGFGALRFRRISEGLRNGQVPVAVDSTGPLVAAAVLVVVVACAVVLLAFDNG